MLYRVSHVTKYSYSEPASLCHNQLRLTPRRTPWQEVLESRVTVEPDPESESRHLDYFGNEVTSFSILEPHQRLTITAESSVEVTPPAWPDAGTSAPWETVRETLGSRGWQGWLDAAQLVFDSPFIATSPELMEYARPSFPAGRPILEASADLMHRIRKEFRYKPKSTTIGTPVRDVLKARQGVCQDFTHLMVGCLRALGLAARYVSGYLRSSPRMVGTEASHAWVSVWTPESGWVDCDPTNDVMPSGNHVTVAWGRDYGDVTPVKGVTLGGGQHTVSVAVRVEPAGIQAAVKAGSGLVQSM
jgi:transglutaminase-like putative cysteine protease